ncbi:MAG: type IV toxin-antitoxin system AbiEi family antitoxin [Candidatus Sericytochromatia bacterium]
MNLGAELSAGIAEALHQHLSKIPFAKPSAPRIPVHGAGKGAMCDFELKLSLPDGKWILSAEVKHQAPPRLTRELIYQLREQASATGHYPVLGAPYVSEASARLCKQAGIGYVDLAGNCYLCFSTIYIEKSGCPNPWPERREMRSLFSPKAENVLRLLWSHPGRAWKTQELSDAAVVSLGQIHKVKEKLLDQEWAVHTSKGLALAKPFELLEAWKVAYDQTKHQRQEYYSLLPLSQLESRLAEVAEARGIQLALTAYAGAARWSGGVRYNRVHAYISELDQEFLNELGLKPVSSGGNLILFKPYDEGILTSRALHDGWPVVQPVQLYLDLISQKGRGEEAAERIMKEVLEPAWQSAGTTIPKRK